MREYKTEITVQELITRYKAGERDFRYHDFDSAYFEDLNLEGASFECSWFHSSTFINCNLSHTNFNNCNAKCMAFQGTDLNGASFQYASIDGSSFENCDLRNSSFDNAGWYGAVVTTKRLMELEKEKNRTT